MASAGVFGGGNTGDSTIQFEFIKSTAVSMLRSVTPKDVSRHTRNKELERIYRLCHEQMYVGMLKTKLQVVEEIPDGGEHHALARRLPGFVTQVSRTEMEKLMKNGNLTPALITAIMLHEVGHDCELEGTRLDDEYDPLLNELAKNLVLISSAHSLSHFIDIDFVEKVKKNEDVQFADLSAQAQKKLNSKYLDFVGDWLYLNNKSILEYRPAPASNLYASLNTSWFKGWGSMPLFASDQQIIRKLVRRILEPSFEAKRMIYFDGESNQNLPIDLSCHYLFANVKEAATAQCEITIKWPEISGVANRQEVFMLFRINVFGTVKVRKIEMW